jgi:signal transduction histidine kinase
MEGGELHLEYKDLTAGDMVERAVQQVTSLATYKDVTLTQEIEPGMLPLQADEDKLLRTLVNLLGNAVKFTPAGGTITVCAEPTNDDGQIVFAISDTGEGIPREDLGRIFEKFGQVDSRKSGRKMSTGLGLTFCKMAVEAHGGRIWVESELGRGSTFRFSIPRQTAKPIEVTPID